MNVESIVKKSSLNLANRITMGRILLVPIFVVLILSYREAKELEGEWLRITALVIFGLAIITDAVDGFIARTRNQKTTLGTFLDPIADKLLLISSIILLTLPNSSLGYHLPFWFAVLAISRDAFIVLGAILIHMLNGSVKVVPNPLGKMTTFLQMISIAWILLKFPGPQCWVWAAALATFSSAIGYFIFGSRQLNGSIKIQ
ncbi:MAG: CDP-alcohol phosphatidyltransferase family protein [Chlamydiae bacterium]|nr:CDP-alcohol phosphatidyltransferase family protein [Chlamydiota bacterium]MBI3277431.1 CDP-alcohol phosphatidyltransferase family protein [Chlamydiota bacterium]